MVDSLLLHSVSAYCEFAMLGPMIPIRCATHPLITFRVPLIAIALLLADTEA